MAWYAFYPAGTLLFKGAEPSDMGADHHASHIFPPPAQTITGALRTAVLVQNRISFADYHNGKAPREIMVAIGEAGGVAPFHVIGPVFRIQEHFYVPAPYSWFTSKAKNNHRSVRIFRSQSIKSPLLKCDDEKLMWVQNGEAEMVSLGGSWIRLGDLYSSKEGVEVFDADYFFTAEPRTGIALNPNRSVRSGHLYTYVHIRLKPEVALAFGTTNELPLFEKGFLKLGAEQRFGRYEKVDSPAFPQNGSGYFLSLNLIGGSEQANKAVIATGKIQYLGGWDMKKGFHKPMRGFFPAGSVFSENIESTLIHL